MSFQTRIDCALNRVGFKLPVGAFRKDDPRGFGYGYFTASWSNDEGMEVTKYSDGGLVSLYSMTFGSFEDFEAWAKDCT